MIGDEVSPIQQETNVLGFSSVLQKVFGYMTMGLIITALTSWIVVSNEAILAFTLNTMFAWLIVEIVVVLFLSFGINKMGAGTCMFAFIAYSIINGVTLSTIFLAYTSSSIASVFLITAGMFAVMAIYGKTTKKDLTKLGSYLIMGLFGLIIAIVVNLFLRNTMLDFIISIVGLLIFIGLTAYDVQKIKDFSNNVGLDTNEQISKVSIMGALTLYLDFINIFLKLLRLMGRRRD